jgi:tyrosine-specific transport protein
MLTLGNKRILENFNNTVVMVVLGTFLALLVGGMQKVDPSLWAHHDVSKLHDVVPVAMCALVFQNVIPLISSSLQFDRKKILSAILLGSGCPMVMYLAWNAMVIGNVPLESIGAHGFDLPGLFHGGTNHSCARLVLLP